MATRTPKPTALAVTAVVTTNPDDRRAHLGMIQAVIARLASNSFLVKGWSVTVAGALLAIATRDHMAGLALIAVGPIAAFWTMDATFLSLEKRYRQLFDQARRNEVEVYNMKAPAATGSSQFKAATSWSVLLVHGTLLASSGIVAILLRGT